MAVVGVLMALSARPTGANPVAVGYGTDPVVAVTDDGARIVVAFTPATDALPDGSDPPALRPVSVTGTVGGNLPIPVPVQAGPELFTKPVAGPSWIGGGGADPIWTANVRRSTVDAGAYAVVIGRYAGVSAETVDLVWQLVPSDKETPWRPRVAGQHGPAGETLFVTYDTHGGQPTTTNYHASYVQRVVNGVAEQSILVSDMPGTSLFRGAWLQPVAGLESGQAFLMSLGVRRDAPSEASLYFHELAAASTTVNSRKQTLSGLLQPGQPFGTSQLFELNGHWVGEKADMSVDRRSGRLWVVYAVNPNPADASRDQGDIHIVRSDDRAATWQPGGPENRPALPLPGDKTQFFPAVDTDANGWIHVAYIQNEDGAIAGGVLHASQAHVYYTVSKDGGATWRSPLQISDDAFGLRFDDPPRSGTLLSIGTRLNVKAWAAARGIVAHVCWTSYESTRRADERALIVCSSITNPLCGNGTVDLGEVCDDGNTMDGDCCSSSCRAETGTPCDDGSSCTEGDACRADGKCAGNGLISSGPLLPAVQPGLLSDVCEQMSAGEVSWKRSRKARGVCRRAAAAWSRAGGHLSMINRKPESDCDWWRSSKAYGELIRARTRVCRKINQCDAKRLPPEYRDDIVAMIDQVIDVAKCWYSAKVKKDACRGEMAITPASDTP